MTLTRLHLVQFGPLITLTDWDYDPNCKMNVTYGFSYDFYRLVISCIHQRSFHVWSNIQSQPNLLLNLLYPKGCAVTWISSEMYIIKCSTECITLWCSLRKQTLFFSFNTNNKYYMNNFHNLTLDHSPALYLPHLVNNVYEWFNIRNVFAPQMIQCQMLFNNVELDLKLVLFVTSLSVYQGDDKGHCISSLINNVGMRLSFIQ